MSALISRICAPPKKTLKLPRVAIILLTVPAILLLSTIAIYFLRDQLPFSLVVRFYTPAHLARASSHPACWGGSTREGLNSTPGSAGGRATWDGFEAVPYTMHAVTGYICRRARIHVAWDSGSCNGILV